MKRLFITVFQIFLLCIPMMLFSQVKKIDSLFKALKSAGTDKVRVETYSELCWEYQKSNPDTAIYFGNLGVQLAIKSNEKDGLGICYNNIGVVNMYQGNYDKATENYLNYLKICEESGNKKGLAKCNNNIGIVKMYQGKYDEAISFYLNSLKINEAFGDKSAMANSYGNIGIVYHYQANLKKAIEYYLKSIKLLEEIGDKDGMANIYNNMGSLYTDKREFEKAIEYFLKAVKINEEQGDKSGLSGCYGNIGNIYNYQGKYAKAGEYYSMSMKLTEEVGDKNSLALNYILLSALNITLADSVSVGEAQRLNYLNSSIRYGTKAINLAMEIKAIPMQCDAANYLMSAYKKLGNFNKALENGEIYIATKDSMFKEEKTKAMAEMETKYQSEKKQLEIDKLAKEKELQTSEMKKQRLIIIFIVCGLLFVLGFAVVLFRLFIQKKKANKIITEKNESLQMAYEEINTQKEEIIVQRDNIQEQKEIIEEHQKEIEDSINYAKRIQQAVMPDIAVVASVTKQSDDLKIQKIASPSGRNDALIDYFILFKPKDIVSGDFYWSTRINEWLIITVADCTGHGVPGAFMSMLGISFLNEIVRKKEVTKASEVLDQLRTSVIDALKQKGESGEQKDGMDIALCVINMNTLEMQFAGANNPLYVIERRCAEPVEARNDEAILYAQADCFVPRNDDYRLPTFDYQLIELKGDKQPIGIHTNMQPFTNQLFQLQKGDTIYLMSDGYEDQFGGPNRKKFLSKNLKQLLTASCLQPMADQKQILETTITEWIGNGEQIDDITVMGIRI